MIRQGPGAENGINSRAKIKHHAFDGHWMEGCEGVNGWNQENGND
jgi:hypothetical protein